MSFLTPAPFPAQKVDTQNAYIVTQLILRQNSENRDTIDFDGCGGGVVVVLPPQPPPPPLYHHQNGVGGKITVI